MAKLDTTGTIKDIDIDYKTHKAKISLLLDTKQLDIVEELKNEGKLDIGLKKYRKHRSLDSNAYMWTIAEKIAKKLGITKIVTTKITNIININFLFCIINLFISHSLFFTN